MSATNADKIPAWSRQVPEQDPEPQNSFFAGLVVAVPISLTMWGVIFLGLKLAWGML